MNASRTPAIFENKLSPKYLHTDWVTGDIAELCAFAVFDI